MHSQIQTLINQRRISFSALQPTAGKKLPQLGEGKRNNKVKNLLHSFII